jgi:hypothetical protein
MQDPIWSLTPMMTVSTTEACATLELPVEEVPGDEGRLRPSYRLRFSLEPL